MFDDEIFSTNVQKDASQRMENIQAPHELPNLPSLHRNPGPSSTTHKLRYKRLATKSKCLLFENIHS